MRNCGDTHDLLALGRFDEEPQFGTEKQRLWKREIWDPLKLGSREKGKQQVFRPPIATLRRGPRRTTGVVQVAVGWISMRKSSATA